MVSSTNSHKSPQILTTQSKIKINCNFTFHSAIVVNISCVIGLLFLFFFLLCNQCIRNSLNYSHSLTFFQTLSWTLYHLYNSSIFDCSKYKLTNLLIQPDPPLTPFSHHPSLSLLPRQMQSHE